MLVVTPYISSPGNEIELSIIGWNKYFATPFTRVIIGDRPKCLDRYPEVVHIPMARVSPIPGMYQPHLDMASKFFEITRLYPGEEGFIRVADDCYPVRPFSLDDVRVLKMQSPSFSGNEHSANGWKRDKWKTRQLLDHIGAPHRNFTIHSPMWYDMTRIRELIERFALRFNSYVIEDLYFNIYHPSEKPVLLDYVNENYRGMINSSNGISTTRSFAEITATKLWFFNTNDGWSHHLAHLLSTYYANHPTSAELG